ncbi:MAG: glycosyltransferase family 2 protein [Prevotella sp.]|jgi:teichuronic acid biosynthesis glycosyltransferase TuaG
MKKDDLVSVIMPSYNAGKLLIGSIESILSQTHHNLELLITDDASTDEVTIELLHRYEQQDPRVQVEYLTQNEGAGHARNCSIKRAKGRYIAFCDSDDRWTKDKLELQLAFMEEKDCALSCSSYIICNEEQQVVGINIPPKVIDFKTMMRDNKIGCLTAIYDTQKLGKKFYMPLLRKRQDWALFLSITKQCGICYAYTEKPLAYYDIRPNSISRNKFKLIKYNVAVYHNILGFNIIKSYLYFFFLFIPSYFAKVMKRKCDSKKFLASLKQHDTNN